MIENNNKNTPEKIQYSSTLEGSQRNVKEKHKIRRRSIWIRTFSIILLTALATGLYLWQNDNPSDSFGNIKEGTPGMSDEDITKRLQEEADKSKISIQINARPVLKNGNSEGDLYIVNPANNGFNMQITIRLDDTGEVIYESGMIAPNHYIDNDKLTKVLKKGEYSATAYLYAYDLEQIDNLVNTATASLIITIQN